MIKYNECSNVSLENLYNSRNSENPHRVKAIFKNSSYSYDVILDGRDGTPDCKISSFGANLYFRTQNGINRKKYANLKAIAKAVKNRAKQIGLELDFIEIQKGEPAII
jgi:hypothetical protein